MMILIMILILNIVKIISHYGNIIGTGYGSRKEAQLIAAEDALKKFAEKQITPETADKLKIDYKIEYEKQHKRVQEAIDKHNEENVDKFVDFTIVGIKRNKNKYTLGIKAAYQENDKIQWKIIHTSTGYGVNRTKIKMMKTFADLYNIS